MLLQSGTRGKELADPLLAQRWAFGLVSFALADDCLAHLRAPFGDHKALGVQQSVYRMHQSHVGPSQALAHPMERVAIWRSDRRRRHKTPRGPRPRCAKAFGRTPVVLVRLHRGLHKLGRPECDCMGRCTASLSPGRRPATGLQTAEPWGQCGAAGHQGSAGEAFAPDDLAPLRHPAPGQEPLGDGHAESAKMGLHRTRLLGLHGCTGLDIILAH